MLLLRRQLQHLLALAEQAALVGQVQLELLIQALLRKALVGQRGRLGQPLLHLLVEQGEMLKGQVLGVALAVEVAQAVHQEAQVVGGVCLSLI